MKRIASTLIAILLLASPAWAAYKIPNGTGAWQTAGTWDSVTNTPSLHATTNISVTTSNYYSATFTAPNTTNACTGVMVYVAAVGAGTSITMTLQENSADVAAGGTVTVAMANLKTGWYYFRFATPYVFTSTTAGYYRFHVSKVSSSGTTSLGADGAGTAFAYFATDDRTGVPGNTDDVYIVGQNGATDITVTVDSTSTIGSGVTVTTVTSARTLENAVMVDNNGILKWDTAASATLNCLGQIYVNRGTIRIGTSGSAYPAAYTATLTMNQGGTTLKYGLILSASTVEASFYGAPKSSTTLWKTTYASGVGTAADPFIVDTAVDWSVGDEIAVCAYSNNAANYNETETRYIKTKNSTTSYVLCSTPGGAEAALTYAHGAGAYVVNETRNIIINTSSATHGTYLHNYSTTVGVVNFQWVRFVTFSYTSTAPARYGGLFLSGATGQVTWDYCVHRGHLSYAAYLSSNKQPFTFTGNIFDGVDNSVTTGPFYTTSCMNHTYNDFFFLRCYRNTYPPTANTTMNRNIYVSNDRSTSASKADVTPGPGVVFNDCEFHCNYYGLFSSATHVATYNNCLFGTKGENKGADIYCITDLIMDVLMNNCTFGSTNLVSNYLNASDGTNVRIHNYNTTAMKHLWYTNYGIMQSTGTGLTDTNVRTTGSYGVRLAPEEASHGFIWTFHIPAKALKITAFSGFFQKNAAFSTDVAKVELWNPGSTSADATFTLADDATWQACSISDYYSGTVDGLATVKVYAMSATASAYLYCDDFYNSGDTVSSTDKVTGLDTWYEAKPIDIIAPSSVSAADIWTFSTTALTTVGTTGKTLVDAEHKADDACVLRGIN